MCWLHQFDLRKGSPSIYVHITHQTYKQISKSSHNLALFLITWIAKGLMIQNLVAAPGETVEIAEEMAARDALRRIFRTDEARPMLPMGDQASTFFNQPGGDAECCTGKGITVRTRHQQRSSSALLLASQATCRREGGSEGYNWVFHMPPKTETARAPFLAGQNGPHWPVRHSASPLGTVQWVSDSRPRSQFDRQYRVFHQLMDIGWVDLDLGSSAFCQIRLRQMGFLQERLSSWTTWWNIPNLSQPNPSPRAELVVRVALWRWESNGLFCDKVHVQVNKFWNTAVHNPNCNISCTRTSHIWQILSPSSIPFSLLSVASRILWAEVSMVQWDWELSTRQILLWTWYHTMQ